MSVAGRIAAIAAVVVAIVVVGILLLGSGGGYTVTARFINASQLVNGNSVEIGGLKAGTVDDISLAPDGQAEVKMSIDSAFSPLRQGTHATIRQSSLSGIANRYVDLAMPPGDVHNTPHIPNGGVIDASQTTTAVDIDQLFAVFDPTTRKAVQDFFTNSAIQYNGKEAQQRLAFHYLNPALSTSSRLFNELDRDTPELRRFLTDSATLVNALATKRDTLTNLVTHLGQTFTALASQRSALAEAIGRLPGFMRQANTTFVDLRSALDVTDPLVNASKPVAPKLNNLLLQLRPLARNAGPTVRDLSNIICRSNSCPTSPPQTDLYHLMRTLPALSQTALDTQNRSVNFGQGSINVGNVRGAFPEIAQATTASAPTVAFGRPYTVDLAGWFDDFSTPGGNDSLGGYSRTMNIVNAFDAIGAAPALIPLTNRLASEIGTAATQGTARTGQYKRCPGAGDVAAADGSNVPSAQLQAQLDCTNSARGAGNIR